MSRIILPDALRAERYRGRTNGCDGDHYEQPAAICWGDIRVLEFLKGRPWDDLALGFVHALRPSKIRVLEHNDCQQCDARIWRVTVYLNEAGLIDYIEQEVELGATDKHRNGHEMEGAIRS